MSKKITHNLSIIEKEARQGHYLEISGKVFLDLIRQAEQRERERVKEKIKEMEKEEIPISARPPSARPLNYDHYVWGYNRALKDLLDKLKASKKKGVKL